MTTYYYYCYHYYLSTLEKNNNVYQFTMSSSLMRSSVEFITMRLGAGKKPVNIHRHTSVWVPLSSLEQAVQQAFSKKKKKR